MNFDITPWSSRIKKNSVFPIYIELENYLIEHTLTEIASGGALIYTIQRLSSYHPRNILNIHMPGKLESAFIEIVCSKSSNIIVEDIYKHPHLYR